MATISKFTRARETMITKKLLRKTRHQYVHEGKLFTNLELTRHMIGHKLGEFSFTKKIGAKIHNSARNRKRKAKLLNKK